MPTKKKLIDKINFAVRVALYKQDIIFTFGESDEEVGKALLKNGFHPKELAAADFGRSGAYCWRFDDGTQLVRFKAIPSGPDSFGQLAHEIFHSAIGLLCGDRIGIKITGESEEVCAYLIDFITREVYKELAKCFP